jgi:TDG/mug DNA glycosylase family protein
MTDRPVIHKPTPEAIRAAVNKTVPDVIGPELRVLFCGINPGLYSGATGHHFARPGNRFWPTLFAAGFTDRLFSPAEEHELLNLGYGITNLVERATAGANDLSPAELVAGAQRLEVKVSHYKPAFVALLGIETYRRAFGRRKASLGQQEETLGPAKLWTLPNPSGLNAHYRPADLARLYRELRLAVEETIE